MINNNKMLYLMHIDWNWIKQRPQYIAEELSKKYDITVMHRYTYNSKNNLVKNSKKNANLNIKPVYLLPNKLRNYAFFDKINNAIYKHIVKSYINSQKPSIIYMTYPNFINCIPKNFNGMLIYDCMDDHIAMENDSSKKKQLFLDEAKAVQNSDIVFVSSEHLKEKLLADYKINNSKLHIIRNGFNGPILPENKVNLNHKNYEISYIGTISKWFDFRLLEKSINDFPEITFKLIGPIDHSVQLPELENIEAVGAVNHDKLLEEIRNSRALIMPFKLNNIIKSVDPVKLYEYINFQKNIITIEYPEIERFKKFVYFYNDYAEYKRVIANIINSDNLKYSSKDRIEFLSSNNWTSRAKMIEEIIDSQKLGETK